MGQTVQAQLHQFRRRPSLGAARNHGSLERQTLLLCFASLLLQEVAICHTLYYQRHLGEDPGVFLRVVAWLPLIPAFFLCSPLQTAIAPLPRLWQKTFGVAFLSLIVGTGLGVIHHVETRSLGGDTLRFLSPWLMLYICLRCFSSLASREGLAALYRYVDWVVKLALLDALIVIVFGLLYLGAHVSNWLYIFGIAWALLQNRGKGLLPYSMLGVCVLATALCSKRTNLVLVMFSLTASSMLYLKILMRRPQQFMRVVALVAVMMVLFVGGIWASGEQERLQGLIVKNYYSIRENIFEGNHDASYQYRVNEVNNIRCFFQEQPFWMVTGFGFGCEIPMVYPTSPGSRTVSGDMHHVHKGWWCYFLRNGLIGVGLLALFCYTAVVSTASRTTAANRNMVHLCLIYVVGRVIAAFGGNLMLEDLDLPIVAALASSIACYRDKPVAQRPRVGHVRRTLQPVGT